MAGFTHARVDELRKVMSKKDRHKKFEDFRVEFFEGARSKGVFLDAVERIWHMIILFSGYSFCKPHSASYARVSFQAAYLKTDYPVQFMATVISKQGNPMKFLTFEDDTGLVETEFFSRAYIRFSHVLDHGSPYLFSGRVENEWVQSH